MTEQQLTIFDFIEEEEKKVPLFRYSQRVRIRKPNEADDPETEAILETLKGSVGVVTDVYFSTVFSEYCYELFMERDRRVHFLRESDIDR